MKRWMLPFQNETKSKCTRKMPHVFAFNGRNCVLFEHCTIYIGAGEYSLRARHKAILRKATDECVSEIGKPKSGANTHLLVFQLQKRIVNLFKAQLFYLAEKWDQSFAITCASFVTLQNSEIPRWNSVSFALLLAHHQIFCVSVFFSFLYGLWFESKVTVITARYLYRPFDSVTMTKQKESGWMTLSKWIGKKSGKSVQLNRKIWSSAPRMNMAKNRSKHDFPKKYKQS